MKSVEKKNREQAAADREEADDRAGPEICLKRVAQWQSVLPELAVLDSRHDQGGDRGKQEDRAFAQRETQRRELVHSANSSVGDCHDYEGDDREEDAGDRQ